MPSDSIGNMCIPVITYDASLIPVTITGIFCFVVDENQHRNDDHDSFQAGTANARSLDHQEDY
jgi:hypothetical protein